MEDGYTSFPLSLFPSSFLLSYPPPHPPSQTPLYPTTTLAHSSSSNQTPPPLPSPQPQQPPYLRFFGHELFLLIYFLDLRYLSNLSFFFFFGYQ